MSFLSTESQTFGKAIRKSLMQGYTKVTLVLSISPNNLINLISQKISDSKIKKSREHCMVDSVDLISSQELIERFRKILPHL